MRPILLLVILMTTICAALEAEPSPVGGEAGLVVPKDWSTMDEAAYRERFPDNDHPAVALQSPSCAVVFSLHHKPGVPLGTARATLATILERIPRKYPNARVHEQEHLEGGGDRFAAASFENPDSRDNRVTTILVFAVEGSLAIATWHRSADVAAADEEAVAAHRSAMVSALIERP